MPGTLPGLYLSPVKEEHRRDRLTIAIEIKPTIMNKSLWDSNAVFIFFCNFWVPSFPPTLYKVKTRKKFWILASNVVCGVRGGARRV